jgi:branched-subunit amino acid transport protein
MTEIWLIVIVVAVGTALFKSAGPLFLGGRSLPPRIQAIVDLLAPVMLTALVVTQTFGGDGDVVVDARVPGVLAGAIAIWRGMPIVPAMVIGAVVTASVRALS